MTMMEMAQDQWEKSKGHRANELGNFNRAAVAVVQSEGVNYFCAKFILKHDE